MRKILLSALLIFALAIPAIAGTVYKKQVMDTTLDNDPTSANSTSVNAQGYSKIGFVVQYDETEVGETLSAAVTVDISVDDTTYLDSSFYDFAGGSTLQTSETIAADGSYYLWLDEAWCVPYVRINVAGTNTDADDTIDVDIWFLGQE